jgi:hypothetical protein
VKKSFVYLLKNASGFPFLLLIVCVAHVRVFLAGRKKSFHGRFSKESPSDGDWLGGRINHSAMRDHPESST